MALIQETETEEYDEYEQEENSQIWSRTKSII